MTSLAGVRTALKTTDSEHATLFTSLIDSGRLVPYRSKDAVKRKLGLSGAEALWYPMLGKKQAPAALQRKLPSPSELHDVCLRDLPEARKYFGNRLRYFAHPVDVAGHASSEADEEVNGMETIDNLTNSSDIDASRTIVTFPSEALDEMCNDSVEQPEGLLRAAMTTCTILPRNTPLPLHHSNEGTTVATLLTGCAAWIIWPPTDRNTGTLQTAYESFAENLSDSSMSVASELEGGMAFVQTEGDGLRIPPFCPMMCLTTKTSVLATTSHVTIDDFISTLQKLPLVKAWFQTEIDGVRMQSELNASILSYLGLLLNGHPTDEDRDKIRLPQVKTGLLTDILGIWDRIKDDLAAMMGPADSEAMKSTWAAFLIAAKGRACWICNKSIRNKQNLMKQHFTDAHWVRDETPRRIDSMEAVEGHVSSREAVKQIGQGDIVDVEDDSAMEVGE